MKKEEFQDDEIDLIALIKQLWVSKKLIVKSVIGFVALGVFVALFSPTIYTASSTFIPQSSSSSGGSSLSGLASLAGINLGGNVAGSEIPPSIYPQIIQSVSFKRELLQATISESNSSSQSLKDFLLIKNEGFNPISTIKKYTIGLPFTILNAIKGKDEKVKGSPNNALIVSSEEEELFEELDGLLSLSVNAKEGFVTLSASMSEATQTAYTVKAAKEILQKTVIDYKIQSAKELLSFNKRELALKKIEFDSLQDRLALFKDGNLNIVDSRFENELNKIDSEFQIVSAVYQELNKQLEQAKLQVSKDTPIFSVIKPATIPNIRSAPKRSLIVLIWGFIGFVLSCGFVLIKGPLLNIVKEISA